MKILVATEKPFAPVAIAEIRRTVETEGHRLVLLENYKDSRELISAVKEADGLIVRSDKVTREILEAAGKLKIVVRAGAGCDNLDLVACTSLNVVAMNTPGQNSNAVAELVFALMLYNLRNGFSGKSGTELRGKTLGLHAFGNVSRYVAEIANGFGMQILAFDPSVDTEVMRKHAVKSVSSTTELYSSCQFVSLHIPLNDANIKCIGYELLKNMPADGVLVNTARKEIIDEEALLRVFAEKPGFRYLADIEPDNKAILMDKFQGRFLFTAKKMGAQTEEANINAGVAAAKQIVDYFKTGNERFRVNKKNP